MPGSSLRPHDPGLQCLPVRVILRGELLAAAVMAIASRSGERVLEYPAVLIAGHSHLLEQLEVLARLLLVPGRGAGRQRHQAERRVVDRMAHRAPRMAFTLFEEDRLY